MIFKNKNNSKGFTLTELIIVIVIIGILAAVLIPTITSYVDRARLSNDRSDARNMNMLLSVEAIDLDKKYFEPSYVIGFLEMNGYDLKARAKNYNFCYNYLENKIEVLNNDELMVTADNNHQLLNNPLNEARHFNGYLVIDQSTTGIANAINTIINLVDLAKAAPEELGENNPKSLNQRIVAKMQALYDEVKSKYSNEFTAFDPSTTVYVTEDGYFTNATTATNIIITKGTTIIPEVPDNFNTVISGISKPIYLPSSVSGVEGNSFLGKITTSVDVITSNTKLVDGINNTNLKVIPESTAHNKNNTTLQEITVSYTMTNGENSIVISNTDQTPKSLPIGGVFKIDFENINIQKGSSIDIKCYTNSQGLKVYDVRIFDINGVLYARGLYKYWLITLNID